MRDLVESWKEMYGADLYACCQMLRDMSSIIYQGDDDAENRSLQNHGQGVCEVAKTELRNLRSEVF